MDLDGGARLLGGAVQPPCLIVPIPPEEEDGIGGIDGERVKDSIGAELINAAGTGLGQSAVGETEENRRAIEAPDGLSGDGRTNVSLPRALDVPLTEEGSTL